MVDKPLAAGSYEVEWNVWYNEVEWSYTWIVNT